MAKQKGEVLLNVIKSANTELIAYTYIISYNYANNFNGT